MLLLTFVAGGLVSSTLHPVVHAATGACHGDASHEGAHDALQQIDAEQHCDHSQHSEWFEPYHSALHGDTCVLCTRQHLDKPDSDETPLLEPRRTSSLTAADLFSPDERPSSALHARAPPTSA